MYRYTWFNKKEYSGNIRISKKKLQNWIKPSDIKYFSLSTWEEHCLECSPPECYGNCPYWDKRFDIKCKKTYYGMKRRRDILRENPIAVQIKFRPWAKIQSTVYRGQINWNLYRMLDSLGYVADRIAFRISHLFKTMSPQYRIAGYEEKIKDIFCLSVKEKIHPEAFLFQCYSIEKEEYNIVVEILKDDRVVERKSQKITLGYNQLVIDVRNINVFEKGKIQVRYYPENNRTSEIIIVFSDFVVFRNSEDIIQERVQHQSLPADKVKCVAWDLDNTIWNGVLIESQPNELKLRYGVLKTIEELDRRGILQIIVSKNDEDEVMHQLERLKIKDYFVYVFANLQRKSKNIKNAADLLNINIDTFALIDDSEFERGEVSESYPQVRVYSEENVDKILSLEPFNVTITADGMRRRKMYQEELKREKVMMEFAGTDAEFIRACRMKLKIENINDTNKDRCLDLLLRTNQLNISGKKYDKESFEVLIRENRNFAFALFSSDKYGDYGQIGFIQIKVDYAESKAYVYEYAMSCRVAEKWLEPTILNWISARFECNNIVFAGKYNERNDRLVKTLIKYGMDNISSSEDEILLKIGRDKMDFPNVIEVIDKTK